MQAEIAPLAVVASALYALIVGACLLAASTAGKMRQQAWHRSGWALIAGFFAILVIMRVFDIEETLRDNLRAMIRASGDYGERRQFQRQILAICVAIASLAATGWLTHTLRRVRGRRNLALICAFGCIGAMAVLIALRMISLHATDRLLYGALKLNWFGDVGLSLATLGAALFYVRVVRASRS